MASRAAVRHLRTVTTRYTAPAAAGAQRLHTAYPSAKACIARLQTAAGDETTGKSMSADKNKGWHRAVVAAAKRQISTTVEATDQDDSPAKAIKNYKFVSGSSLRAASGKANSLGEDAFFVSQHCLGVADGVGSWTQMGVDPGLFSRKLMSEAKALADSYTEKRLSPKQILRDSFENVCKTSERLLGSCTACIIQIQGDTIKCANLGDSGFRLFRRDSVKRTWSVVLSSKEQTHFFNCPFQLAITDGDKPEIADEYAIVPEPGDVLIAGTDGLFDNLFNWELVSVIDDNFHLVMNSDGQVSSEANSHDEFAKAILDAAYKASRNTRKRSPFAVSAQMAGYRYEGGKEDDITVLTAVFVNES